MIVALAAAAALVAAPGAVARAEYSVRPVVTGLDAPLYITAAPGEPDRLYVVEQAGRIRIVERYATSLNRTLHQLVS